MKFLNFYKKVLKNNSPDDVFNSFISGLKPSILLWSYFVNWDKVFINAKKIEIALNNFNYLIGKQDFDNEFKFLIKQDPSLIKVIPYLIVRDGSNRLNYKILVDYKNKKFVYEDYDFSKNDPDEEDLEKYLTFVKETGLKNLMVNQKVKNLVDYMIGIEAGIDSNGRKNRSGHCMEDIVEYFINDLCLKSNIEYLKEANSEKIKNKWDIEVPVDKTSRRFDFVLNAENELIIIETNFYSGGGSKLKSTAGEYRNLYDIFNNRYKFIWITDGFGWKTTLNPLRETFDHNEYVFNLNMLELGILEHLVLKTN
ncbi:MAG: type II restriction endonuclease [Actinomycetota bacterium]|nr:type II restriction endonuclease [Actinomycetota bacterium]